MAYYVRKIARAKWTTIPGSNMSSENEFDNYRADTVANDLRTTNDTLSFWKAASLSKQDLEPIIVINSLLGETISKIDLICVPDEMFLLFPHEQKDGKTVVKNYKKLHYNLIGLSVKSLYDFAKNVIVAIVSSLEKEPNQEPLILRISEREQLDLIQKWVDNNEIIYEELTPKQQEALSRRKIKL